MKKSQNLILCLALLCGAAVLAAQAPQWQWAVGAGGPGFGIDVWDSGKSIATDSQGNQYVTGTFLGTATFGSHVLTASGDEGYPDIFIARLDPSGNWLWAVKAGGTGWDEGGDIAVDGAGNAYVTGGFCGTATFGSHSLTANGYYYCDIFVAKLDPNGNWLWAVQVGGTSGDAGYGIALDGVGNAYVTGVFCDTATFGSHSLTTNGYYCDIFVAKLDPNCNWLWAVQAGGTEEDDCGAGIALDGAGNAYLTGFFRDTATFGNQTLTAGGGSNIFVAKLSPYGNWLWAVNAGGTSGDAGYGIALDGVGNAYVTGVFCGTATFGSYSLTANGYYDYCGDIFVAKLGPNGNWLWAVQAGGLEEDYGAGIALDGAGNAYLTGFFRDTATFGNHTLTPSGGYVDTDIFVAKLGNVTPVEDDLAPEAVARLHDAWPNPLSRGRSAFIKADITERSKGTLSVFNLRGQSVARHELGPGTHQITFSGDGLPAGVYLYSLQCGAYRETKKLVLLK